MKSIQKKTVIDVKKLTSQLNNEISPKWPIAWDICDLPIEMKEKYNINGGFMFLYYTGLSEFVTQATSAMHGAWLYTCHDTHLNNL